MVDISGNMRLQFQHLSHRIEETAQSVSNQVAHTGDYLVYSIDSICQKCTAVTEKTSKFVIQNKQTIFFIGCCAITAYTSPFLFFPSLVITGILRLELERHLKKFMNEKWKDEHNPYKIKPQYGPSYINSFELALATIGTVDAIALATLFVAGSWTVALLPALCGVAAGSCLAKKGMDMGYFFPSQSVISPVMPPYDAEAIQQFSYNPTLDVSYIPPYYQPNYPPS